MAALVREAAEALIADAGLARVDVVVDLPEVGLEWAMSNLVGLAGDLGDRYPDCNDDLTPEIQLGMNLATHHLNVQTAGTTEMFRIDVNERMADIFDQADFIFSATNPDTAFAAAGPMPTTVGEVDLIAEYGFNKAIGNNGALTIPANLTGNPAVSIPAGLSTGCPSACRSSAATTRSSSCSTWPGSPNASGPGRWWPQRRPPEPPARAAVRPRTTVKEQPCASTSGYPPPAR